MEEKSWQDFNCGEIYKDVKFLFEEESEIVDVYYMLMSYDRDKDLHDYWNCARISFLKDSLVPMGMQIRKFTTDEIRQFQLVGRLDKPKED